MRKKRKPEEHGFNVWRSYSDMMAGVLLLFVLIMCVTLFQAQKSYQDSLKERDEKIALQEKYTEELLEKQNALDEQAGTLKSQDEQLKSKDKQIKSQDEELSSLAEKLARQQETLEAQQKKLASQKKKLSSQQDTLKEQQSALDEKTELLEEQQEKIDKIIGVKAEVVEALQKEFEKKNLNVDIDPQTGALTLNANVMFDYDQAELTDSGKMTLSMVLPDDSYKKYLGEIIIDGYTDTDGDYSYNLELSQKRSLAVAQYLLDIKSDFLKDSQVQELKDCLTVNGHSMSDPVLDADGNVDKDASRRVEVKFRLKDEEMIQELNKIMQGDSAESDSTAQKKEKNQKENQDNKQ